MHRECQRVPDYWRHAIRQFAGVIAEGGYYSCAAAVVTVLVPQNQTTRSLTPPPPTPHTHTLTHNIISPRLNERAGCYDAACWINRPGSFSESKEGSATFPEISTEILEKVIQYFHYKQRYQNSREPVPEFPVNPEQALALLMASNFLDC